MFFSPPLLKEKTCFVLLSFLVHLLYR
jgi:hypothetical protein